MKHSRKLIALVLAFATLLLSGCLAPDDPIEHVHIFDMKVTSDDMRATEATCTERPTYYFSCRCGEKSDKTFVYGDTIAHTYTADCDTFCDECGKQRKAPAAHGELDGLKCPVCGTEPRRETWTEFDDFTKN